MAKTKKTVRADEDLVFDPTANIPRPSFLLASVFRVFCDGCGVACLVIAGVNELNRGVSCPTCSNHIIPKRVQQSFCEQKTAS